MGTVITISRHFLIESSIDWQLLLVWGEKKLKYHNTKTKVKKLASNPPTLLRGLSPE